jgi:GrpB-like predicted nucleotidyltransferase (UPF0157 family)/ribosomal protein S18 acetylase RimI-like enzyme
VRETAQGLDELVAAVEHIGSTAVPGLVAKPVIDLALGVRPGVRVDQLIEPMAQRGWIYRGDAGDDGGWIFVLEDSPWRRVAHAHGVAADSEQWRRYLQFRDLLRCDVRARQHYARTKERLARKHPGDAVAYIEGKTTTVWSLLSDLVSVAEPADVAAAVAVWRAANEARGLPPSPERIARVEVKLRDPRSVLLVARRHDRIVGMLQAEHGRAEEGHGCELPDLGHVSMVFVDPDCWGYGIGAELMAKIARLAADLGWQRLSLWTRAGNERARRLYESDGYEATGDAKELGEGDLILRYQRSV